MTLIVTNKDHKTNAPPIVVCEFCGSERYTQGFPFGKAFFWKPSGAEPCECKAGQEKYNQEQSQRKQQRLTYEQEEQNKILRQRISRITTQSGMSKRFLECTFDNYLADDNNKKAVKKIADNYAKKFKAQTKGLFIYGSIGVGKTHIVSAIANYLLNQGTGVICMNERQLLGKIKDSFNESRRYGESESSVLNIYKTIPLLVIDDMGKEKATDWTLATLYAIVDARYEAQKPIAITTNYDPNELIARITPKGENDSTTAQAIVDRLLEMTEAIHITGQSYRTKAWQ